MLLVVLAGLAWAMAGVVARTSALDALRAEAVNIEEHVLRPDGSLAFDAPPWSEPHHRYLSRHIDPYFVQIFSADGRLLRASDNVRALGAAYPQHLRPEQPTAWNLRPFVVEGIPATDGDGDDDDAPADWVYAIHHDVRDRAGRLLAVVQVGRFVPPAVDDLPELGGWIALAVSVLVAGWLGLVWALGGWVVRPLEALTAHARSLHPDALSFDVRPVPRVPVPDGADAETRALALALDEALARLAVAFDEQRRFTADAAHELQTPLTALLGHTEVALRRERTPDQYRAALERTRDDATALIATVRALLALARFDRAAPVADAEALDLADLVASEVRVRAADLAEKPLALRLDAHPAPVVADRPLVADVLRIVLDNALKYTDAGTVTVRTGCDADGAWVEVQDTGIGLSEADLAHAGRRFFRARAVQDRPGTGIGLALAGRIAERLGGTLTLASRLGVGTRATLRLPVAPGSWTTRSEPYH